MIPIHTLRINAASYKDSELGRLTNFGSLKLKSEEDDEKPKKPLSNLGYMAPAGQRITLKPYIIHSGVVMTLIEAAEVVLGKANGSSLSAREITDQALRENLIKPKSAKPWVHLQSAIRLRNQQLLKAGKKEQFSLVEGKWTLN